ncbi:MAG TPA: serine protease [bacterium]|nr:serine protease [bacterium]
MQRRSFFEHLRPWVRTARFALVPLVVVAALGLLPSGILGAQESASLSVFELIVMQRVGGNGPDQYRITTSGTGFFIAPDGTALTTSHVVYPAYLDPAGHRLLAIVNGEFYGVRILSADPLPYDPTDRRAAGVPMTRDVATIRLSAPEVPFDQLVFGGGAPVVAHRGAMPSFPALTLGGDPAPGERIRVFGFGRSASPIPHGWSAQGTVDGSMTIAGGTLVFDATFTLATEPGHSGSPVLDSRNRVVGMWAWHSATNPAAGTAISSSALGAPAR